MGPADHEVERRLGREYGLKVPAYRRALVERESRRLDSPGETRRTKGMLLDLVASLASPETYFFRHPDHFRALHDLAMRRKANGQPCRVLSAGCSTGEEAWSAAAVLAEAYGLAARQRVRVDAWDVLEERIGRARTGRYGSWSQRIGLCGYEAHFTRQGDALVVPPRLRSLVGFDVVNLAADEWPAEDSAYDAIFFRNVSLYFRPQVAARVRGRLAGRLAEDGLFFLGPSDGLAEAPRRTRRSQPRSSQTPARRAVAGLQYKPKSSPPEADDMPRKKTPRDEMPQLEDLLGAAQRLADAGRVADALTLLETGSTERSPEAWLLTGILLLDLSRHDEAVHALRRCCYWDPHHPVARRWLDLAIGSRGDHHHLKEATHA